MKYWEDFFNEVTPYVENCPSIIVKHQVRNAAIEFCQRSGLWRREMDRINIAANIHTYEINTELSVDETISAIDYAFLTETTGSTPLGITTEDVLKASSSTWRTITATRPEAALLTDTENCRLYPIPSEDINDSLVVGVILKPSRDSSGLPDWIFEQWAEKIACGAKAKLYSMKSRPWYDAQESLDEQDNFDMAIKDATIRTNKGNSRINLQVQMRPLT